MARMQRKTPRDCRKPWLLRRRIAKTASLTSHGPALIGAHLPAVPARCRPCPDGGIGRRTSFRCWRSQGRGGSSPLLGTIFLYLDVPLGVDKMADFCHFQPFTSAHCVCLFLDMSPEEGADLGADRGNKRQAERLMPPYAVARCRNPSSKGRRAPL